MNESSIGLITQSRHLNGKSEQEVVVYGRRAADRLALIGEGIEGLGRILNHDLDTTVDGREFAKLGVLIAELGSITSCLSSTASEALEFVERRVVPRAAATVHSVAELNRAGPALI
ncbi:hypothetical protein [Chitinimonas naiadis]